MANKGGRKLPPIRYSSILLSEGWNPYTVKEDLLFDEHFKNKQKRHGRDREHLSAPFTIMSFCFFISHLHEAAEGTK